MESLQRNKEDAYKYTFILLRSLPFPFLQIWRGSVYQEKVEDEGAMMHKAQGERNPLTKMLSHTHAHMT